MIERRENAFVLQDINASFLIKFPFPVELRHEARPSWDHLNQDSVDSRNPPNLKYFARQV